MKRFKTQQNSDQAPSLNLKNVNEPRACSYTAASGTDNTLGVIQV
jgi:hypothetical protein